MKAKKVYEFIQSKEIRTEIGASELIKRSIKEFFDKYAPTVTYVIDDDLRVEVKQALALEGFNFTEIPDIKIVRGYLNLESTNITKLPENLTVYGGLFLSGSKIKELPKNLKVHGTLNIYDTKIEEIPNDLYVINYIYKDF